MKYPEIYMILGLLLFSHIAFSAEDPISLNQTGFARSGDMPVFDLQRGRHPGNRALLSLGMSRSQVFQETGLLIFVDEPDFFFNRTISWPNQWSWPLQEKSTPFETPQRLHIRGSNGLIATMSVETPGVSPFSRNIRHFESIEIEVHPHFGGGESRVVLYTLLHSKTASHESISFRLLNRLWMPRLFASKQATDK